MRKTALTIAGSDCSGGAGIQADIKTMTVNGVYAMSAVTALTAQNTLGVEAVFESTPEFLEQQLDCVFRDIFPDAVKVGMVSSPALIEVIADRLILYGAKHIVVDPVMISTSGDRLLREEALDTLQDRLLPLAEILTPNIPEAELLIGHAITTPEEMEHAADELGERYLCAVLLKGGHRDNDANDLLYAGGQITWYPAEKIDNPNTHGTGCTLSSAIAANLAKGCDLEEAVGLAKDYVTAALRAGLDLGNGNGPIDHITF